jgi:3-oxoacyl-[acyl-carrier protein] reductase
MAIELKDRVCLITGAGRGIGRSVAEGFAARGAIVVATDIEPPADDDVALPLAWDVGDPERAKPVIERVVAEYGRLDAFVANAGVYPPHDWNELTFEDWRYQVSVNLDGAFAGIHAASQVMANQGYGKIVAVSSVQVRLGPARHIPYAAAKAGLVGLIRSMARALGPRGVRVNAILPGAVRTPAELELFPDQEQLAEQLAGLQCLPDRLLPAAIEPTFAFLCSAESDAITGQAVCVDHGLIHW